MRFRHFFKAAVLLLFICSKATFANTNNSPIKKDNSSKNSLCINSGKTSLAIDPPKITAVGNQTYCVQTYVKIATSVTITHDPAETSTNSVDIQISSGYVYGEDVLSLSGSFPNIISTWNIAEGKLILSSSTGGMIPYSDFEIAIENVEFYTSSPSPSGVRNFSINLGTGQANYLPRNGHFYEYVPALGITWTSANTAAATKSYYGLQGYLATITAADEAQLSGAQAPGAGWIGGSDSQNEGVWKWVTGPEAGTIFWNGVANGTTPNFAFWNTAEPNQYNGANEDYAHVTAPGVGITGSWNDLTNTGDANGNYQPKGYIVEYGGMPGDPVLEISASTTITIPKITSTTPSSICGSGVITLQATATDGAVDWYATPTGGVLLHTGNSFTTPTLTTTTSYYVDASNGSCTNGPRTEIIATINPIPTITSTTPNSRCDSGTVTLGALASGGSINWYNVASGGTSLGTGTSFTTPSIVSTTTYYVDATASSGCTTPTRTAITATVNNTPSITSTTPASRCETGTVTLEAAASAGTINWYNVPTGGTLLANGTSFTTPSITATTTYYVDATSSGCTTPTRTAITATVNISPSITSTTPDSRCDTGTVTLGAVASAGTINWYSVPTGGTLLANGTSFTTPILTNTTTYYVDAIASGCTTPNRTAITATINISPSITAITPASRCDTGTLTLGAVASAGTINWYDVSTGGTALATGTSFTTPSITTTTTYYVDAVASGCTTAARTAVTANITISPSITSTTPASRCDTGSVILGAVASAGTINWYDVATGGTSLATGTSFTTPSITATTTYYVDATDGCTNPTRTAIVATINPIPTITSTTPNSRCDTGTVTLGAVASAGTINWYDVPTGGTLLGTGTSFTTPIITATTTYYVDAIASGCTTATRTAVTATVNTPPAITSTSPASRCDSGTVTLGAVASSGTINWYDVATGGTSLGTGASFTTPSITATTTYYVDTTNQCASPRVSVVATVYPVANINEEIILCQTALLDASISGMNYLWSPGGETTQTIVVSTIGDYSVTISSPFIVCDSNKYIKVIEHPAPIIKAIIVNENSITIELENPENYYEFSIDGELFQASNQFSYIPSGQHTAYVREKNLCNLVQQDFTIFSIAKYFTPNNDGFNDVWQIKEMKNFPSSIALIFDRYGKLITTLSALNYLWDGKYNNNVLPADDYWYRLKMEDSKPEIKGHFTLKR